MSANMRFRDEASFQAFKDQRSALLAKGAGKVEAPRPRKASKYRNEPVHTEDGYFDSKAEAARFQELKLLEKSGQITAIARQVPFRIMLTTVDGVQHVDSYVADFVYFEIPTRRWIAEDKKGFRTESYKRKARLMREVYGIEILES